MRSFRRHAAALAFCLLAAALLTLLCSQSSPLYPLNLWDDANCLLTVGRVMRAGGVLYRDIYEQKGPTLYLIHALAAAISDTSFFGVFLMEALAWAATLFFFARTLRLRLPPAAALGCAALLGALVMTSPCFMQGDSAEEFCLPFVAAACALALRAYAARPGPMPAGRLFACGVLAGLVATVKYTSLGLFVGLCLCEGALALRNGGAACAARRAGVFLVGMALPVALWCAYFAANGALWDFFTAYVYNNVFLYDAPADAQPRLIEALRIARDNAAWMLLAAAGLLAYARWGRARRQARLAALAMGVCAAAGLAAGRLWPYCVLPLAALAPVGLLGLCDALRRLLARFAAALGKRRGVRMALCALALPVALTAAWGDSPNAYLRGRTVDSLAQGRLAAMMEPGASLLQYSHLDDGLYLLSGALPQGRFFVRLNVRYGEMLDALDRAVREGEPDYVLVSWRELPPEFTRYRLIAADTAYDDAGRLNKPLYLYGRAEE